MTAPFLLWDHDGVLVDTERWYFESTRQVIAGLGVDLSHERYLEYMAVGGSGWELARAGADDDAIRAGKVQRNALYQEMLRSQPIEIDGVGDVLGELSLRHRMGIVTTARREDFELIHAGRDLVRHFEFVLTVEDYDRSKPHPDPYLAGLAKFGAGPQDALAIEDSSRGLAAARAAGLRCVVIRTEFTAAQDFTGARREVDSIRQVPEVLKK